MLENINNFKINKLNTFFTNKKIKTITLLFRAS